MLQFPESRLEITHRQITRRRSIYTEVGVFYVNQSDKILIEINQAGVVFACYQKFTTDDIWQSAETLILDINEPFRIRIGYTKAGKYITIFPIDISEQGTGVRCRVGSNSVLEFQICSLFELNLLIHNIKKEVLRCQRYKNTPILKLKTKSTN